MTKNKYIKFAIIAVAAIVGVFLIPLVLKLFLPFILGFLIASMCQKIIQFFERRLKINREISSVLLVIFIVGSITLVISLVLYQLIVQIVELFSNFPELMEMLKIKGSELYLKFSSIYSGLPTEFQEFVEKFVFEIQNNISNAVSPVARGIVTTAKNFAFSLPDAVIFIVMFILSTFFFTKDYQLVINFLKEILSKPMMSKLNIFKDTVFGAFFKYIKAQLIMMCIIGTEITIALWILGIDYPLVWGLLIGFMDALPFFGTSIILVPWAIINFIYGDYMLALAFIIIQFTAFITRQLIEPRIVSSQIGLHPILTLISIYIGLKIFGVVGMIITPIIMLLIVNFYVSVKDGKAGNTELDNSNTQKDD